jgi:predicted dinucleotide-binding enzyme
LTSPLVYICSREETGFKKIAIVGAGNVGTSLGAVWTKAGHDVTFGVRDVDLGENAGNN